MARAICGHKAGRRDELTGKTDRPGRLESRRDVRQLGPGISASRTGKPI